MSIMSILFKKKQHLILLSALLIINKITIAHTHTQKHNILYLKEVKFKILKLFLFFLKKHIE